MFLSLISVLTWGLQRLLKYLFAFNLFSGIFTAGILEFQNSKFTKSQNKVKQPQTCTNRTSTKKEKNPSYILVTET